MMDSLVPLLRKSWPQLREEFKKNWPFGVPGYYLLDIQLAYPSLADSCNLKIFCPYGVMSHGFVASNVKDGINEVIILPTSDNANEMIEALATTKLIDWSQELLLPFADTAVVKIISKVLPRVGAKIKLEVPTIKHFLPKTSPLYELKAPPGTYMGPLKYEHIDQVDRAWPHRHATSTWFFKLLIDNGLTYGLFSSEDHGLLAWVTISEAGFLTHLYSEERHRKKGYAEFVVKYVSNEFLKEGKDVFCYILEENVKSINLFKKLCYEVIGRGVWTFVVPAIDKA